MIPRLEASAVRAALSKFDTELRLGDDWTSDGRQKYAIKVDGRLYPPKEIVRLVTGKHSGFGSIGARQRLQEAGFEVTELELKTNVGWTEFINWSKRISHTSRMIQDEKAYKLDIVRNLEVAKAAFLKRAADWLSLLKKAFGPPNNLTPWNTHDRFLKWCSEQPQDATEALEVIWRTDNDLAQRIDRFVGALPEGLISRRLRVTLSSFLIMGEDPENLPIYRSTPFDRAFKATGFPALPTEATAGQIYSYALDFIDRFMEEAEEAGLELADRLEAQGAIWTVMSNDLSEEPFSLWNSEERNALMRFRGEVPGGSLWWVNQGSTYAQESAGGYVWAPQRNVRGSQLSHHINVSRLRKGHRTIHYANGSIRAVGTVLDDADDAPRPPELPEGPWEGEGRLARLQYAILAQPIRLDEIPIEWRIEESNPFDSVGNVRQGYMYPISSAFWEKLAPIIARAEIASVILVGAQGGAADADRAFRAIREILDSHGREADWWSYPLQAQHKEALALHPYLYLYVGAPTSKVTHRLHVVDAVSQAGPDGIETPWPEFTRPDDLGKRRRGEAQSEIYKTWFLVDALEELPEPLTTDQLTTVDGRPAVPAFLLGGFGLWKLKEQPTARRIWIFQANPDYFDLRGAVRELSEFTWTTRQHAREIHVDDLVYLWEAGGNSAIVATALVITEPAMGEESENSRRFAKDSERFAGERMRCMLSVQHVFEEPVSRAELLANPVLQSMAIFRAPQQTNFPISQREAAELERLVAVRITDDMAPTLDDLARETYMSIVELSDIRTLLSEKRQLILEGPPGSGKTYVARLFARYFTGNRLNFDPDERVQVVQFHQSYGYEEFIQGIRPSTVDGALRYDLQPGIFRKLCATAVANPDKNFVIIIDEINRGNISRIFGELLYLLEYRGESVRLGNSPLEDPPFFIPKNVYLIGTMNTTDRSLAQIDYALRRRFFFYRLMPVVRGEAPVLGAWLRAAGIGEAARQRLIGLFVRLNAKVVALLGEHYQLGHSYFMKPGIERQEVIEQVWQHSILPLLEEYFHNHRNLTELLDSFSIQQLLIDAEPFA